MRLTRNASQGIEMTSLVGSLPYFNFHCLLIWQDLHFLTYDWIKVCILFQYIAGHSVSSRRVCPGFSVKILGWLVCHPCRALLCFQWEESHICQFWLELWASCLFLSFCNFFDHDGEYLIIFAVISEHMVHGLHVLLFAVFVCVLILCTPAFCECHPVLLLCLFEWSRLRGEI